MVNAENELALYARETLMLLSGCIGKLSLDEYTESISLLSESSSGEHTRHILELFQQLLEGYNAAVVNYEDRKRAKSFQENIDIALIISNLDRLGKTLLITSFKKNAQPLNSSYHRKLLFNIEHCIHHQAMIKIALLYLKKDDFDEGFGVAKATLEHNKRCVQ
jgi:hypothetical protein